MGHKLWQGLSRRFCNVYVSIRKPKSYYEKCGLFRDDRAVESLDLRDFGGVTKVLDEIKPSMIINCAGVTLRHKEAGDKISNITMNALLPHKLAAWCSKNNSRLIHFSTVCVFDGKDGGYSEDSQANATDLYGRTKFLGEVYDSCALIIRSSFVGREIFGGTELLEWFLSQKGKRIKGYKKALFTGLTTNRLAELTADLIKNHQNLSGLYHVSSETLSKYDLLLLMKEAYKVDVEIVPDDGFECRRDLRDEKFRKATGFACSAWKQMMREMAADPTPYNEWRQ